MARTSIEIESFQHANPIPAATRIGPLVVSSITPPTNPGSRDIPDSLEAQIDNLFTHVGQMLEGAGATWDDMAKMTFYVTDPAASRPALNGPWLERFPRSRVAPVPPQHEGGRRRPGADLLHLRGLRRRLRLSRCLFSTAAAPLQSSAGPTRCVNLRRAARRRS